MSNPKLSLEILNGPLDGYVVTLETETTWGKEGEGMLIFPWDSELGAKQARFFLEATEWWIESYNAPHGTYYVNDQKRIKNKIQIEKGDVLKASDTWLRVRQVK